VLAAVCLIFAPTVLAVGTVFLLLTGVTGKAAKAAPSRLDTWLKILLPLLVLAGSVVVFQGLGKGIGKQFFDNPRFKTTLTFKTEVLHGLDGEFLRKNSEGDLRGLVQTKDFVVVFVKRESTPRGRVVVVSIPMANLISVRNESLP
jgi:hypothetical protein